MYLERVSLQTDSLVRDPRMCMSDGGNTHRKQPMSIKLSYQNFTMQSER